MQRCSKKDERKNLILCTAVAQLCRELRTLPALAVLHVGVGSGLKKSLCDLRHAAHHFCRVFLGAERTDEVKRGFNRSHCGCVHLSRVTNQEDGGKLIPW